MLEHVGHLVRGWVLEDMGPWLLLWWLLIRGAYIPVIDTWRPISNICRPGSAEASSVCMNAGRQAGRQAVQDDEGCWQAGRCR